MDRFLPNGKPNFKINNSFQKDSMLQKLIHIVSGIVLLAMAHIFGTLIKSYIYRYGKEEVHVERKKGETQLTSTQSTIQEQKTRLPFIIIGQFVYYTVLVIAIMMVLKLLGVETTGLLALIGAAGFAIGLALQGTLSDIASGILLAVFQVYTIGEIIEVDGIQGKVRDFTLFQTILVSSSNDTIMIPNRKIQEGVVINHTRQKVNYVNIDVVVSNTNKDYTGILEIIKQAAAGAPEVVKSQEIAVYVSDMSSGTKITAEVPINSAAYSYASGGIMTAVREALAKNNIAMLDCTSSCSK